MKHRLPLVLSVTAFAVALLGATPVGNAARGLVFPAHSIGARELKDGAVVSAKVKDSSLLAKDFKPGQLPAGPQGSSGSARSAGQGRVTRPARDLSTPRSFSAARSRSGRRRSRRPESPSTTSSARPATRPSAAARSDPTKGWILDSSPAVGGQPVATERPGLPTPGARPSTC